MNFSFVRRIAAAPRFALLALACTLALGGCLTEPQVRSIVRDSNSQLLLASIPGLDTGLPTNPADDGDGGRDDAAARIQTFLASHPNDPALADALRLRQAMLYLGERALPLADRAVQQIGRSAALAPRDTALLAAYPDLRWWAEFSHTAEITFSTTQRDAALRHIASLEQHAASPNLAGAADLRDYLLEMRAWIGLKLGLATVNDPAFTKECVEKAVNTWTNTFVAEELALLNSDDFKRTKPFDLSTRRVIRTRALLRKLAAASANATFTFQQPEVARFYAKART